MSELKPCPFCGGEASVNDDPTGNGGKPHMSGNVGLGRLWSVECDECGADAGFRQDRNVAIAAWNSRAERTCEFNIKDNMNETEGMGDVWIECSACHCAFDYFADDWLMKMSYCPSCGARKVNK